MPAGTPGTTAGTDPSTNPPLLERICALERAITDSDDSPQPVPAVSAVATDLRSLEERVADVEASVTDLTARQQAVEAYADRIEHVNDTVERRADAALAAVDRLESVVDVNPRSTPPSEFTSPASIETESTSSELALAGAQSHVSDAASTTHDRHSGASEPWTESTHERRSGVLARLLGW